MNLERERIALDLVEEALEWPKEERDERLLAQLAHDPGLLADVRGLLKRADDIAVSLPTEMPLAPVPDDPPPPERIGPYRLRELLGSGGMGRVYRAERADGLFEQTIAIKLMRRTRLPEQVAAQFARERQILARFRHPNIAHLLDGGVSPAGLSYFVMELVEGESISRYVSERKLGIRPVLMLFRQICSAVQYAHARLVVHADIKPSNIIVTHEGTVKLLDFGVARVIEEAGQPAASAPAALGITHYYASPARRNGEAPNVIDDVYSLGVLLKEMLGRFDSVPADLLSVGEKAGAVDPAARYGSVDALMDDVGRWLEGVPVRAHGAAWSYVAGRFFARHRLPVIATAVGVLLLAGAVSLRARATSDVAGSATIQGRERAVALRAIRRVRPARDSAPGAHASSRSCGEGPAVSGQTFPGRRRARRHAPRCHRRPAPPRAASGRPQ
jgi:hypothetical protein